MTGSEADWLREIVTLRAALEEAERARDRAFAELSAMEERRKVERSDEQHHLRNTASVIRAIVHRTGDEAPSVEEYCGLLDGRLAAYLAAQMAVAREPDRGLDLELLLRDELLKFGLGNDDRIRVNGPSVGLTSRAAGLMALVFHDCMSELIATGFDPADDALTIRWSREGEGSERRLLIDWVETVADDRPLVEPSLWSESLGRAMEHQLGGSMTKTAEGNARIIALRLPQPCHVPARGLDRY